MSIVCLFLFLTIHVNSLLGVCVVYVFYILELWDFDILSLFYFLGLCELLDASINYIRNKFFVSHLFFEGKKTGKNKLLDVSNHEVKESHSNHF